jgi:hypothetical protein
VIYLSRPAGGPRSVQAEAALLAHLRAAINTSNNNHNNDNYDNNDNGNDNGNSNTSHNTSGLPNKKNAKLELRVLGEGKEKVSYASDASGDPPIAFTCAVVDTEANVMPSALASVMASVLASFLESILESVFEFLEYLLF